MDIGEYRKRALDELEGDEPTETLAHSALSPSEVIANAEAPLDDRIAAVTRATEIAAERPEIIDQLIGIVANRDEAVAVRIAAIDALQSMAFLVAVFAPHRPAYHEALRSSVTDPDPTIRRRSLGLLARAKDEYAERRLVEGLEHPSKALVPPVKAIQFLGYDVHTAYFPLMRRIVDKPPSAAARREAIRLLASDPKSHTTLERIMTDKGEQRATRQVSAVALQSAAPARFATVARSVALDPSDDVAVRATSLGALASGSVHSDTAAHRSFTRRVATELDRKETPAQLRKATRSFMARGGG
jgi:hypothetical protein